MNSRKFFIGRVVGLIALLIALGIVPLVIKFWSVGERQLTAEEVVDLEVQAQQQYEATGGTY